MDMTRDARTIAAVALILIVAVVAVAYLFAGVRPSPEPSTLSFVSLPDGFEITTYAGGLNGASMSVPGPDPGPRFMAFYDGTLYVTVPNQGRVLALPDADTDGVADKAVTVADGLNRPHGIAFYEDQLYVASTDSVVRFAMAGMQADAASKTVLIEDLPTGGHWTRTIQIRNDTLFLSVGSSCNACRESNEWRAKIHACDLDGADCETYARGLRNAVGFVFHDGRLIATENGRDHLGNDLPPDEINVVEQGGNYGWPECYGKNVQDPKFKQDDVQYIRAPCSQPFEQPSTVDLQAHSAPLGLAFYTADRFPAQYRGDLFVAYHGSWNRQPPTGYKIVRIPYDNGTFGEPTDFATGWLDAGTVHGRPVDIVVGPDGAMYVTDDNAGRIYRITYDSDQ